MLTLIMLTELEINVLALEERVFNLSVLPRFTTFHRKRHCEISTFLGLSIAHFFEASNM